MKFVELYKMMPSLFSFSSSHFREFAKYKGKSLPQHGVGKGLNQIAFLTYIVFGDGWLSGQARFSVFFCRLCFIQKLLLAWTVL